MTESRPVWSSENLANPHAAADKAQRVRSMFAAIAPRYDLNNRLHSLGRDQAWRKAAVSMASLQPGDAVLDVACGTGDLTLAFAENLFAINDNPALDFRDLSPGRVIGLDFTPEMLKCAQHKVRFTPFYSYQGLIAPPPQFGQVITWLNGDALRLPLPDGCVDVVSIAFGIRNVSDPAAAIREFARVLRPGGRLVILEFSLPRQRILRAAYNFYFRHVLPRTAALIAHDRSGAYRYLPQSVQTFIDGQTMLDTMAAAGLTDLRQRKLTLGIAAIYRGVRKP